jgi:threonine dehydratase
MLPSTWFTQAAERLSPQVLRTPLTYDPHLDIYIKWENHQATGSFKVRGALNKVLTLLPWERDVGIVTASAGNHGLGVAYAAQAAGSPVIVFASETASAIKLKGIRKLGAEVKLVPGGYGDAEAAGIDYARTHNKTWISAYNDGMVIAGQGTIGSEILDQLPERRQFYWIIPCGGGGLASGIAAAVKSQSTEKPINHQMYAVQSEASSYMHAAYYTSSQEGVVQSVSLADGLAGPIEDGSITIPLARRYLDGVLLVSEADIALAVSYAWHHYNEVIEASAATSLAAVLSGKFTNRPAILIISGGNINPETHQKLIALQT